jgi:HEAT repeat protein
MRVFAFDRDWTVDVNPHPQHEAVPLEWVRHLAHETDHAVYAIGNQDLADEAAIPGVVDIVGRHPDDWDEWLGGKQPDGHYERFPTRRERLALIADLHPGAEAYVVVDDLDLGDVDGWTHYHAWEFVPAVERGDVDPALPWAREPVTDGGCPTGTSIEPDEVEAVVEFLEECDEPPGFEITYEGDSETKTVLCASVTPKLPSLGRPADVPTITCEPVAPGEPTFSVRAIDVERLAVVDPDPKLYTASAETPAEEAIGYRRLAAADPDAVSVESLLALLDSDSPAASDESLRALSHVASARPGDCTGALPALRALLDGAAPRNPAGALAVLREIAAESPGDVAPMVDVIRPYLVGEEKQARRAAVRCLAEVAEAHPEDVVDAVPALATVLEDEAPGQQHAMYALTCVSREYPEELRPVAETIAARVVDDDLPENTRLNATAALGRVISEYPDVGPDIVDDVAELLDAETPKLRANAAGFVSDMTKRHTVDIRPYTDRFLELLTDDDTYTRINASATVSRLAEDFPDEIAPARETILELLTDDHELVRVNACWALGHLGERATDALPALEELRKQEQNEKVLTRAQWAIAAIEDRQ